MMDSEIVFSGIEILSLALGMVGIAVTTGGALSSLWLYIKEGSRAFQSIRLVFSKHLIIGLDFFVAKDIIDTMLIDSGAAFWEDMAGLVIVVVIRVVLTLMAERELDAIDRNTTQK